MMTRKLTVYCTGHQLVSGYDVTARSLVVVTRNSCSAVMEIAWQLVVWWLDTGLFGITRLCYGNGL